MAMDLRDPNVWVSHLLENLPEEKLASALKDDNPNWEYIDGEIVKLGSLAHSQLDIPELQRRGLVILASESKDFRLLAHLLRTLQHAGDPHLALRLLALYVEHYWAVAAPQNMAHKKRFASQVIKRFETGIEVFSQNAATAQRDALSGELAKLAQCWQSHNAPELAQATDDLFALYQRAFNRAAPAPVPTPAASGSSPQTTATSESGVTQPSAPAPQIVIDSHDDKAWRDTLLKVAAILCERQPDSPQGYRLRRHALWQNITSTPQAESDGRTPLAAVSADMVADYHAQLGSADMALWQQVEKSVLLAPYWLDGHCLSAQTALRLGYKQVADAIRDEVIRFLERLPRFKVSAFWLLILAWIFLLVWIWWKGPMWTLYEEQWLKPLANRWLATAAWGIIALVWLTVRVMKRLQQLEKMQKQQREEAVDPLSVELNAQQRYLDRWLLRLQRHLDNRRFLWQLPWYMVIGPAGSGKTTLLREGFPSDIIYAPEGARGAEQRLYLTPHVGKQAVIFDIDGTLCAPADADILHRRLWEHALGWLKEKRARQPLNGIILTLDLPDLLTADKRRREHLLQTLRSRLQDIRQHLHCQLPVYVVLTRLDLLQGFAALFQSLNRQDRDAILGVTFTRRAHENDDWRTELNAFWQTWVDRMNLALPDLMVAQTHTRASLFSFSRQMQGSREPLVSLLEGLLDGENMNVMLRGVYLTSSLQRGQMDDIFTQSAARQYRLGNNPLASWPLVDTAPYFTRSLFPQALLAEPNLATESRAWLIRSRRRLTVFSATGGVAALLLITGWHHYYNGNYQSGITVLKQAKAFMDVPPPQGEDDFGNLQLPLLNPVRDATLAYGDWGDRSRLADMGLYQGRRIGPYVEQTYLQLLEQRYLPSLFNGLVKAMNAAPPESEEKLAVLRVMRMLEDKSGRNNEVVKQYMAKRWSEKFHGQRDIQAQLMSHLDYALAHTDWHAERQAGDGDAISRWTPYDKPVVSAQKELSKLPVYQRVYQSLKTRALGVLPADLNLRDQVGPTFDQVFTSADDNKLVVPQFITRYGLQSYFVKQRDELVELTAMDSWVLNLTRNVKYSDADRAEIQHQLTEQYISDYTATWRAGMDNLNIRNFESIGQLTGALEQVISGDQPLQRALTVLRDNTQPGVFSEKLSAKEREEALAEPDYQLLTRLGHEFAPENSTLAVQKDKESTMQAVYQQLTELHRYLLAIQNAPVPGKSALKAVQLRLDQNSSDPIFATRQMAKTLPAPLNRWVGRLADQAWHVVMVEAVHYMEVDWRDSVVKPFNEQLANNYPFNPRSAQDASLDAFERFFKPDGILDTFYQQNLKLFIDNDLSLEDGDNNVIIREDIIAQLETAQKIRDIFFSKQNGLGTSFAVETVSLSGNKRRSVLNLDGQLVDYSQGRNYTAHLVWPNNMREGNESKLTLIGTSGNAPRSISFSGPWAQFRLFGAGQLTGVQDGNFTVRFSVDGGAMTYRVHTDTEDNPFSGGLFSQFGLSDTLY
ncbi:type VI secretion system membrane subunit TssM [Escherichia coli]|nr:type VI secretion system membrane subunit TssM [Escherichia coli]EIL6013706.1 type VI secretion system membrane subunit TssM [Escherichia coli]EIQ2004165.1 type VI secretion system membrane subunit TssM [Escherichia coli]EJF8965757.1 type VI secretion system membrane subunit TssM [Escherichia coli]EJK0879187.1 type VI secretion system membrane subunit TssM [Escherichia coli]